MKITHKFLAFCLFPALVQGVACIGLFYLLNKAEYYTEKAAHQTLVARKLVQAMSRTIEVAVAAGAYAAKPLDVIAVEMDKASARAEKIYGELRQLTQDDPVTHAEIEELLVLGMHTKTDFFASKSMSADSPLAEDSPIKNIEWEKLQYGRKFAARTKQLSKILDRQSLRLEETLLAQQQQRTAIKQLIIGLLIFWPICLVGAYVLFRYDFSRRFTNLLAIAQDLALDRPPSQLVSGSDELRQLSDALVTAAEARREAVAQKQLLFQMVTHDLRSPLMAASLTVDTIIKDDKATAEKKQSRLQSVERSLQRVVGLSNDLLTIERLSAGGLELSRTRVDFKETIQYAIETVLPLAEQKHCSLINLAPSLAVSIDEDRILQVTVNLLANAIKYSPQGGEVEVNALLEGNRLRAEVLDRGPGISEKDIKRLFNPFQQVSESDKSKGFGLGLTIAKMLVELHDGKIGASARPGGGTIFWFFIRLI